MASSACLADFLEAAFSDEMRLWKTSSSDEEAVRAIVRGYLPAQQRALHAEIDELLARGTSDLELLTVAHRAHVHSIEESAVREWFRMIRNQVRVVINAAQ